MVRLGLWILRFKLLRRLLSRWIDRPQSETRAESAVLEKIAWAVTAASRIVPGARTCLVQALAAQVMLVKRGYPARFRLGVAKDKNKDLQAHAWVESDGVVVIGGADIERYNPLISSEEKEG
jgi:hypothetical protein